MKNRSRTLGDSWMDLSFNLYRVHIGMFPKCHGEAPDVEMSEKAK